MQAPRMRAASLRVGRRCMVANVRVTVLDEGEVWWAMRYERIFPFARRVCYIYLVLEGRECSYRCFST